MKKMRKVLSLLLVMAMALVALSACSKKNDTGSGETTTAGSAGVPAGNPGETVALTVWGAEEDQTMLQGMIDSFKAAYPDVNFDISLGVESESTAKDTVLVDVEAAADVYAFASDQLSDLIAAGALMALDDLNGLVDVNAVKTANNAGSVEAAMQDGKLYAFPMTADNGFFLFYNPAVISAEDVQTWDGLLAAAQNAGKKVGMTLASGWYNASFFFGAGFETGLNEDGTTICDFNGTADYTGVEVTQAMLNIASNPAFMAIADGAISGQIASGELCAVISGTWDIEACEKIWGTYEAAKLPTYTIGSDQVQQGSFAGYKMVGVNPYSANVGYAALLADWLTNEQNQQIRFEQRQLGPSNNNVAASEAVQSNKALAALSAQSAYGRVQLVGGGYWSPTATFGEMIAQGTLDINDTAAIQAALDTMVEGVTAPVQ